MSLKLSKRIKKIIELCEPCDTIIDVGTDHGKVAITVANINISNEVIAIDNKKGPLQNCENNAKLYLNNDSAKFTLLLSDGLTNVNKNKEIGIIITGMGYDNIRQVLFNIKEYNFKYLILSPHTKINELISYLDSIDLMICEQECVFEDEKYYYIIKVKRKIWVLQIKDLTKLIEKRYPLDSQMSFDNSGANVVNFDDELKGVLLCLDVTLDVIDFAAKNNINLIISHHPIIFNEIKSINSDPLSIRLKLLIKHSISAYSIHTNFDVNLKYGMWTALKKLLFNKFDIAKEELLLKYAVGKNSYGLGNIVYFKNKVNFNEISNLLIDRLELDINKVSLYNFNDDKIVKKAIILPGSGSGELEQVITEKPDLFITSDLKHNQLIDLYDSKISYINATHYGLEKVFISYMYSFLKNTIKNKIFTYYLNNL